MDTVKIPVRYIPKNLTDKDKQKIKHISSYTKFVINTNSHHNKLE
jgi:hypothetical protein